MIGCDAGVLLPALYIGLVAGEYEDLSEAGERAVAWVPGPGQDSARPGAGYRLARPRWVNPAKLADRGLHLLPRASGMIGVGESQIPQGDTHELAQFALFEERAPARGPCQCWRGRMRPWRSGALEACGVVDRLVLVSDGGPAVAGTCPGSPVGCPPCSFGGTGQGCGEGVGEVADVVGVDGPPVSVGAVAGDEGGGASGAGGDWGGAAGLGLDVDHAERFVDGRGDHEVGAVQAGGQFVMAAPADEVHVGVDAEPLGGGEGMFPFGLA